MNTVTIFTDGSSRGNPGPGGWGVIVLHGTTVTELGGGEKHTTNNRMELTAVIEALEFVSKLKTLNLKLETVVNTDSSYVLNGATKWLSGWQKNNWKTKAKGEVLNQDLWERLADVLHSLPKISWHLIKGHSGVPANERCDVIATSYADGVKLALYNGPSSSYAVNLEIKKSSQKAGAKKKSSSSAKAYSYISSLDGDVKVHSSWAECEARVKGKSKALYKKSLSKEDEVSIISQWKKHSTH